MSAAAAVDPVPVPLARDEAGRLVVVGTRVSLDVLVEAFTSGKSPEAIHESFSTVTLADIYAVLAYYLHHKADVDSYLAEQEREADEVQSWIETKFPAEGLRAKLLTPQEK